MAALRRARPRKRTRPIPRSVGGRSAKLRRSKPSSCCLRTSRLLAIRIWRCSVISSVTSMPCTPCWSSCRLRASGTLRMRRAGCGRRRRSPSRIFHRLRACGIRRRLRRMPAALCLVSSLRSTGRAIWRSVATSCACTTTR
ncbi:unnamed protein product [Symbiodinium sp. CCMP2456]|nr:unnamed protein product [Symbiodinium sp. CCMP2456]